MARVIIGDDVSRPGEGNFWAGWGSPGASGFHPSLQDNSQQIVHTTAGLYMSSTYGAPGEFAALSRELYPNILRGGVEVADYKLFFQSFAAASAAKGMTLDNALTSLETDEMAERRDLRRRLATVALTVGLGTILSILITLYLITSIVSDSTDTDIVIQGTDKINYLYISYIFTIIMILSYIITIPLSAIIIGLSRRRGEVQ